MGTGTTALILDFNSPVTTMSTTGNIVYNYTPNTAATPEPSSIALLGTGLLGFAGVLRKRFA